MKRFLCSFTIISIISIFLLSSCSPSSSNSTAANLLILVNKNRPLPNNYVPSNLITPHVTSNHPILLQSNAAKALEKFFTQAKKENIHLVAVSGYRSYQNQEKVVNASNKQNGEKHTSKYVATPGKSEHQTGLAVDVNKVNSLFENSKEAQWLVDHCAEYGFIIRYPKGKEAITGYAYEPWHIRYVGINAAKEIMSRNLTLEEYLNNN